MIWAYGITPTAIDYTRLCTLYRLVRHVVEHHKIVCAAILLVIASWHLSITHSVEYVHKLREIDTGFEHLYIHRRGVLWEISLDEENPFGFLGDETDCNDDCDDMILKAVLNSPETERF